MKFKVLLQSTFFMVLICFTLLSCNGGENAEAGTSAKGFLIEGSMKSKIAGKKISIDEILPTGLKAFDSTKTDDQGHFVLKGIFKSKSFFLLRYEGGDIPIYMDSVTKMKIMIDESNPEAYDIKGNEANIKLKELIITARDHYKQLDDLQKRYPSMPTDDSTKQVVIAEYTGIMNGRKDKLMKMIVDEPASPAGIFGAVFMLPPQDQDLPTYIQSEMAFYDKFDKKYNKDFTGYKHYDFVHKLIESALATSVGRELTDFNLPDVNGNMIKLSSLRGQYVLVDFWASWCRPCRMENPNVVKAYNKYHSKGFEILGVSLDDNPVRWKTAIEADNLTWKHVSELKGWQSEVCRKFNVNSIPFSILLDKNGVIIATNLRGEELEKKLKEVLGE